MSSRQTGLTASVALIAMVSGAKAAPKSDEVVACKQVFAVAYKEAAEAAAPAAPVGMSPQKVMRVGPLSFLVPRAEWDRDDCASDPAWASERLKADFSTISSVIKRERTINHPAP